MNHRLVIHYNRYSIILAIIIFLNLNGFYMINNLPISMQNVSLILEALFFGYVMLFVKGRYGFFYGKYVIVAILFVFTSSVMANYSYSQPLWYGIRAQRQWICSMLMYFPIVKLIKSRHLTKDNLICMIDFMNLIYIVLVTVQYILGTRFQFMIVMTTERYGTTRLFVTLSYVLISYYVHLLRLIETRKWNGIDVFFVVGTLFLNIAVTKSRMAIIALIIATTLAILSIRFTVKKLILILSLFISVFVFFGSRIGQDTLSLVFNSVESVGGDTSEIRELGREFYIESASRNWKTLLFGCGFANLDWPQAVIGAGVHLHYNYNDNGMFGLFFYYGLTFVVWVIVLYIKLLKDSWKYARMIFFLLLADLLGCSTLFPSMYSTTLYFPLICAILEGSIIERKAYI